MRWAGCIPATMRRQDGMGRRGLRAYGGCGPVNLGRNSGSRRCSACAHWSHGKPIAQRIDHAKHCCKLRVARRAKRFVQASPGRFCGLGHRLHSSSARDCAKRLLKVSRVVFFERRNQVLPNLRLGFQKVCSIEPCQLLFHVVTAKYSQTLLQSNFARRISAS